MGLQETERRPKSPNFSANFAQVAVKRLCHGFLAYLSTAKIYIFVAGNLQMMVYLLTIAILLRWNC